MTEKNYKVESYNTMITVSLGRVELELHDDGIAYIYEKNRLVKVSINELSEMIDLAKQAMEEVKQ